MPKLQDVLIPEIGTLLTFVQFIFVAVTGYITQFDRTRPPFFLAPNKVPIRRWIFNIVLFFSINVLNNHAFSYDISVPVHIILRSGGSITTMIAGYLYGKRYPCIQVLAVILLTLGVILAAWSDAQTKVYASLIYLETSLSNLDSFRESRQMMLGQLSVLGLSSSLLRKFSQPSWASIQRQRIVYMDPSGKKTSSTRTSYHCRFSFHLPHRWPVLWDI